MSEERLINNLANSVSQVSRYDIAERATDNFRRADADYGQWLEAAVKERRGQS